MGTGGSIRDVARVDPQRVYRVYVADRLAAEGKSPYAFARAVAIPAARFYEILNGTRSTTIDHVLAVANAAGVSTSRLFADLAAVAARIEERAIIKIAGPSPAVSDYEMAIELAVDEMVTALRAARHEDDSSQ